MELNEKKKPKDEMKMNKLMQKMVMKENKVKLKKEEKKRKEVRKLAKIEKKKLKKEEKIKEKELKSAAKAVSKGLVKKGGDDAKKKNEHKGKKKRKKTTKVTTQKVFIFFIMAALLLTVLFFIITRDAIRSFFLFSGAALLFSIYLLIKKKLAYYNRIKKMEQAFPDFISLMASNLRAGMTIDRSLILSARKEFDPLDKEIMQVGKDILTAREITEALHDMGERINSEEIKKTLQLLISGIRSGGNLSVLLEQTAKNMRERIFVKKRAASNVLMYVIFIFFAVSIGAPLLFGLSSVLVEIMSNLFSGIAVGDANVNLPFTLTEINVSTTFILYFSIVFIITSAVLASLILGLVSKGQEREGLRYTIVLIVLALTVFFVSRWFLIKNFAKTFI
ncbi:MAG: type II secretion system F family protein [Nanoarchaeota archaeon]